jgi:hypothetical protein
MNLQKRFALSLATVAILGLTAAGASASTIAKATFTLPAQAYWNSTLLQPGEYTLSVERNLSGIELLHLQGENLYATFVIPVGVEETAGHSCLKMDDFNGTYVIRELDESQIGRSYRFGVSKAVQNLTLRGATSQPVSVPLSAAAGL